MELLTYSGNGKELYRVTEAMALLSLSRSVIYEQLRCNRPARCTSAGRASSQPRQSPSTSHSWRARQRRLANP